MFLEEALKEAARVCGELRPYCDRIEIAGSIRREKEEPKDIEIVAIPKFESGGLFDTVGTRSPEFIRVVDQYRKIKGSAEGKYAQRMLPSGIALDLFIAEPGNWGLIFAIRTGSAEFSHTVLARGWVKNGFKSDGGYLWKNGVVYRTPEEIDLFNLACVPFVAPKYRSSLVPV